jgi:hypothetical protein
MPDVGDQFSEKTVVLVVKGLKLGAQELAKILDKLLKGTDNLVNKITTPQDMTGKGEQTVKQLVRQGQGVSNIEINNKNIKSFESVARKYGVDFALKKDNAETPPKWLVFFKAKDADALTAAFKEFSVKEAKRSKAKKPSVVKDLAEKAAKVKIPVVDKVKNKSKGGHEL